MPSSPHRPTVRHALALAALFLTAAACRKGEQPRTAMAATGETAATAAAPAAAGDTALLARADEGRLAGARAAKVWLVEVSDFQCPYCKMFHDSTYAAIRREYVDNGKVRMAYVHLPLSSHRHAMAAAEASMCAAVQGKFWQVHDGLFDTQLLWSRLDDVSEPFAEIAQKAGVEMTAWRACMASHAVRPLVQADAERAERSGIGSTPSFIIGNQLVEGAQPIGVFRQVLDSALATAARGGK